MSAAEVFKRVLSKHEIKGVHPTANDGLMFRCGCGDVVPGDDTEAYCAHVAAALAAALAAQEGEPLSGVAQVMSEPRLSGVAQVMAAQEDDQGEAVREALDEARADIEAARNAHWQARPLMNGDKSFPADYAIHDTYYDAARIVREVRDRRAPQTGATP